MLVIIVQNNEIVAAGVKGRLQNLEMNGRHLRADNCVLLAHFLCKGYFFYGRGANGALFFHFFPHLDCG